MKTCVIYGDMQADRAGEQYPTVNLCDDCVAEDAAQGENHQIVSQAGYDPDLGACHGCGTTAEEEAEGQA